MSTDLPRTDDQYAEIVRDAIAAVAPELEPDLADLDPAVDFWIEFELDSMDHLAVMTRIAERTGIEIPESDYPRLNTLVALSDYLRDRT